MNYTGIGARETPKEVLDAFTFLGEELAKLGFILRSGGAEGADTAFEKGCDMEKGEKEIYLPWKDFNQNKSPLYQYENCKEAFELAKKYHPCWESLSQGGRVLMARNGYQVLGADLQTPTDFIICYTKDGKGEGGTGQAIRIAKDYDIKVCDFGRFSKEHAMYHAKKLLELIKKEFCRETIEKEEQEIE